MHFPKDTVEWVKSYYQEKRQLELISSPTQQPLSCLAALWSQLSVPSSPASLFKGRDPVSALNPVFMFAEVVLDWGSTRSGYSGCSET